jgi:hypothetical protein
MQLNKGFGRALAGIMLVAVAGCDSVATPQAQARSTAASADSQADNVLKPIVSRPIVGPEGNTYQCDAYPGGGAGGVCVQR